jgi:hypothetical protein
MNRKNWILLIVGLALIGGAAGVLARLQGHLTLSPPGVKTHPLPGSANLQVELPEKVLDYTAKFVDPDEVTTNSLPKDTSYGEAFYTAPDNFCIQMNVVLMGTDRTSMHKPQFCLEGQGFHIEQAASEATTVHIDEPCEYDLPIVKLLSTKEVTIDGKPQVIRAVYVYWFVADDAVSASVSGFQRMWWFAKKRLTTGVLQRWAYVSCFSVCRPGQEAVAFEKIKQFIAVSVPEFQLYPKAPMATASNKP